MQEVTTEVAKSASNEILPVRLPQTAFPMRANLPANEPATLERWATIDWTPLATKDEREDYVLLDGPPYANGHLHIGHAVNKILKDVVVRSRRGLGYRALYQPGWDCHGLPIEWKIEEQIRAEGKTREDVPVEEIRRRCREFAEHWVEVQKAEFQRIGVHADWSDPYLTMSKAAQSTIVKELGWFLVHGGLYRGKKPVLWSVVEQTALADAEVEYHDRVSPSIDVGFPIVSHGELPMVEGARVVIWTTTPWTIPANRAIAYGAGLEYALIDHSTYGKLVVATRLLEELQARLEKSKDVGRDDTAEGSSYTVLDSFVGDRLAGVVCQHPWAELHADYARHAPLLPGDHVADDTGTGFVHTAPGHGEEDFDLGRKYDLDNPDTVSKKGVFLPTVALMAGESVFDADPSNSGTTNGTGNGKAITLLKQSGQLLALGKLKHSYPHSWRSKAPLMYRNTAQWFISMAHQDLRATALKALEQVNFYPAAGRTRLTSMIAHRPDWCISRQRAWGVPLPIFVHRTSGEPLRDPKVIERVVAQFQKHGADCWFSAPAADFLGPDYNPDDYTRVTDIADVWFDSGSAYVFGVEERGLSLPADIFLEGSDQHRGWFHSSLLHAAGTRGIAPYKDLLTHGFALDGEGRKMSKSLGNIIAPQKVIDQYGADILRLWVITTDYTADIRISQDILKQTSDIYRRIRNTLRWLLGNLPETTTDSPRAWMLEGDKWQIATPPESDSVAFDALDRYVLARLASTHAQLIDMFYRYEFMQAMRLVHDFCSSELSALYFDIRKDRMYCDDQLDAYRRGTCFVLDAVFGCLVRWLAPVLCFTAEDAWGKRYGGGANAESVHLTTLGTLPPGFAMAAAQDNSPVAMLEKLLPMRDAVNRALEAARREGMIKGSLEAMVEVVAPRELIEELEFTEKFLSDFMIVSRFAFLPSDSPDAPYEVHISKLDADHHKCERCWRYTATTLSYCDRCLAVEN